LEDADAIFHERRRTSDTAPGVTFSGLLNAIDGIGAPEHRVLILTTNHADRLDPALLRPGRIDLHVRIGHLEPEQAGRLFLRFFPSEAHLATLVHEAYHEKNCVPAQLQNILVRHRHSPLAAVEEIRQWSGHTDASHGSNEDTSQYDVLAMEAAS
jgi:mitochondrial chaperone BCS1